MTDETMHPAIEEPTHVHVQRPSRRHRGLVATWPEYVLTPVRQPESAESDEAAA